MTCEQLEEEMEIQTIDFVRHTRAEPIEDIHFLFTSPPRKRLHKVLSTLDQLEESLKIYDETVTSLRIGGPDEEEEDERECNPKGKRIDRKPNIYKKLRLSNDSLQLLKGQYLYDKELTYPSKPKSLLIERAFDPPTTEDVSSCPIAVGGDPFEGIEDLDEVDFQVEETKDNFATLRESIGDDDGFDASAIDSLSKIRGYSYLENKLSEINSVKIQAEQWDHQLNLLLNPQIARALVQVLSAKQKQIKRTFEKKEITEMEHLQLSQKLEEVRKNITNLTSANTIHATKMEVMKVVSKNRNRKKLNRYGTLSKFDTSSLGKKFKDLFQLDDFFHSCIIEGVCSVTEELFSLLLSKLRQKNLTHVHDMLQRVWQSSNFPGKKMTLLDCRKGLTLLEDIRRDLEVYHPEWKVLGRLDRMLKDWKVSAEPLVSSPIALTETHRRSVNNLFALALQSTSDLSHVTDMEL